MAQGFAPHAESRVSKLIHIVEWSVARMDNFVISDGLHDGEVFCPFLFSHIVGLWCGSHRGITGLCQRCLFL